MHQPNKSQSPPPHLRSPSSQGSITGLPFDSKSMRQQTFHLANASVRRIGASRRGRPAATSIADIFVRSLVIAGYCQEHSPRSRCLSTMSMRASTGETRNWEDRCVGKSLRRLQSGSPSSFLSRIEGIGMYCSRTQRMLNSSVAQRVAIYDPDDHRIDQTSAGQSPRTANGDHVRDLGEGARPPRRLKTDPDRLYGDHVSHNNREHVEDCEMPHDMVRVEDPAWEADRKSAAKKLYQHTSEVYQALFEGSLSWKEAADAVAAFQSFPKQLDETESAVDYDSVRKFEEHLRDKTISNHYLFTLYRQLPFPGVKHLSKRTRGALLRRYANPQDRRWVDARRYLALVEDMLTAHLPMSRSLWTTAIYLAARSTGKVFKTDLIRAIGIWNQMEHIAGIESDSVIFTILFDIAVKAGQYTVANRLKEEMDRRNIQFGRHGKIAQIFYQGLLGDVNGVFRAFDQFVKSGELVDTAVMNCLMVSFLRANEPGLAEKIYLQLLETEAPKAPEHFANQKLASDIIAYRKEAKKFGRVLQVSASLKDSFPEHHRGLQQGLVLSPDTRTFYILLAYHARESGSFDAFKSVLRDMEKVFSVPPRGMIYLLLFEGFAIHGRRGEQWTAGRLRMVWKAYLRALHESKTRVQHQSFALPPSFVWENPLGGSGVRATSGLTPRANPLYVPLLSAASRVQDVSLEDEDEDGHQMSEDEDNLSIVDELGDVHGALSIELKQERPRGDNSLESLEHRLENGVFLGRTMIIKVLRAFGACCGPDDIMEAWLRIESVWQPWNRKALDVAAVKDELEKQLNRATRREKAGLK
ncbi:pentatricopeptide repeat protein [Aspergillus undulatus]|uniref:pentatricopeptide repeat protein n=1 Tax=Aspergillus undulatus TaxID=1810928 RepID=UPI003CCE1BBF